ncbi:MAG: methyltransferase domain-containing protein [Acidisphaera sp.]|nr:methyltransferase domain-containing protein [Acidisphaera sp.]
MTPISSTVSAAALASRARALIDAERVLAARPLIEALRRMDPDPTDFAELESRVLVGEGLSLEALDVLDTALKRDAANARLLLERAEIRLKRDDLWGGADDAAAAVIAAPADPVAKAVLGVALIRLSRHRDAVICLTEAARGDDSRPSIWQALAEAQEAAGDPAAAQETLADAVTRWPGHLPLRIAAVMHAMRARDFHRALALAESARRSGTADACIFGLLGHALSSLCRHEDAAEAYAEALKLAPEDPYVRHVVRASGLLPQSARAPAAYVEAVFDGYAERFDQHLLDLGYRVPGLIRKAVIAGRPKFHRLGRVLDLGCGTGLVGVALSDLPMEELTGVDLSGAMLDRARGRGLYSRLIRADIVEMLRVAEDRWDLVVAGDVLNYFGDLDEVVALVASRLAPGGRLIASFESLDEAAGATAGWRLERQGRFAHRRGYLENVVGRAGLQVVSCAAEALRSEGGSPVTGILGVFARWP